MELICCLNILLMNIQNTLSEWRRWSFKKVLQWEKSHGIYIMIKKSHWIHMWMLLSFHNMSCVWRWVDLWTLRTRSSFPLYLLIIFTMSFLIPLLFPLYGKITFFKPFSDSLFLKPPLISWRVFYLVKNFFYTCKN